jgi:acyl transferase domain-containing protein/thioesterase domain-containing protein/acyl carrier protein
MRHVKTKQAIQEWLISHLAEEIGVAREDIDPNGSFDSLGVSSREAVTLSGDLEDWLGRKLSPTLLWEYPTIDALAGYLAEDSAAIPATQPVVHASSQDPIAMVGIGCRFPGADGPGAFWTLLTGGTNAVGDVPADRWDNDAYYDPTPGTPGKMYTRKGGFLDRVDLFDADFFGISPREAARMDPQQRLVLEVAWEALEHANIAPDTLGGSSTGVFMGISANDYARLQNCDPNLIDAYAGTGNAHSLAANRLSYFLDLRGPSIAVDTACSSSLVAVHQAVRSLRAGECALALAGGVNVILSPETQMIFSHARMMSPDGRCKTFDASADGYVRGEGCGVVVLKGLSDAQADGNRIYAVLRGSAVNHDGRSNGLTAPNGLAQQAVIRLALANAGLAPADIDYVEAHGTGTALGDPIEVDSLKAVLLECRDANRKLLLGSAKTNIGHLESAAGVAGLIKTALMLHHGAIVPHLHLNETNPLIDLDGTPIEIPTTGRTWGPGAEPHRAGVSSFGFGGANAHVILEEAPALASVCAKSGVERPQHVLTLSAHSEPSLKGLARRYSAALTDTARDNLADVCFTANTARATFEHRLAVSGVTATDIAGLLKIFEAGEASERIATGSVRPGVRPKLAFLFTGQGSQYVGMGRTLYETQPVFREALDRCDAILRDLRETPLLSVLYPEEGAESVINETSYTQPALFAIEYALAELWRSWGIEPDAVMGHSVGEYVAACVAGVFDLEDGLRLVAERARLMGALPEGGAMVAVLTEYETVAAALGEYADRVSIAAVNGPKNTVISGDADAVDAIVQTFEAQKVSCKRLTVSHAFHSPLMDPMLDEFEAAARAIQYRAPRIPVVSNLTGRLVTESDVFDAPYWRAHLRQAVQFDGGIRALHEAGYSLFLESGPAPVLSGMGVRCLPRGAATWLPSLSKGKDDWAVVLGSVQKLYVSGVAVDWRGFDAPYGRTRVDLPTYPFERERHWLDISELRATRSTVLVPAAVAEATNKRLASLNGHSDWLYQLRWIEQPRTATNTTSTALRCLVFVDERGAGEALAQRLESEGHACVRVARGDSYRWVDASHAEVNSEQPADYEALLRDFADATDRVIHCWSLDTAGEMSDATLDQAQGLGCRSALHVAKALYAQRGHANGRPTASRALWLVTSGAQYVAESDTVRAPMQAPMWGFGRCLAIEHADLWGGMIDVGAVEPSECVGPLYDEIVMPGEDDQIALHSGTRRVARLQKAASVVDQPHPTPFPEGFLCRRDGAYLITGGLGGLGLEVARWLADRGAEELIILSRTAVPPRDEWDSVEAGSPLALRISALNSLETRGVKLHVAAVDVANDDELERFIDTYRSEGGVPIRGVVHAAGVLEDHAVMQLDSDALNRVLRPKVNGSWHLHHAFNGGGQDQLDFFILFSSAASILGSPGQANYAAGNAFMDSLAHYRRAKGQPALSINWGPWAEVGMAANAQLGERLAQAGIQSIPPSDGLAVLESLVVSAPAQVGVMNTDWELIGSRMPKLCHASALSELIPLQVSPATTKHVTPTTPSTRPEELEIYLRRELAKVLYRAEETIPLDRNFIELGLDSIMMMEVMNSIERDLGLKLFPKEVFDRPTIQDLAPYLAGEIANSKPAPVETALPAPPTGRAGLLTARRRLKTTVPAVKNKPVVFLLSGPRCGSTLLRVMMAGHPDLFCPPELHLLQFNSMREWSEDLGKSYLGEGLQRAFMEVNGLTAVEAKALLDDLVREDVPVEKVYAMLQDTVAPRLLVDKSPSYGSSIETLEHAERIIEGAKYIHLVRHPYSAIESFMRNRFERLMAEGETDSMTLGEDVWSVMNANIRDFLSPLLKSKHHMVRYEDLVSNPEKTMKALCAFLEIPFDPAVLNPYEGQRMTDGVHAASAPVGDPNFMTHQDIDPSLGTVWKRIRLPRRLGGYARRVAGELGYSLPVEETLGSGGEPSVAQTVQHVIRVQPKGDCAPFFCAAPAGGIAYTYFNLPQYIGDDTPFYALQDPSLNPTQDPYETMAELASEHVAAIRAIQPEGPYYVGGWSFGGAVAFEIAQQLTKAGHTVALLAIMDTEARVLSLRTQGWRERVKWGWNQLIMCFDVVRHTGPYIRDGIYLILPSALKKSRSGKNRPSAWEYITWAWADAIRHLLLKRADIANVVSRDSRLMLIQQPSTRRAMKVLKANWKVLMKYIPESYSGKITILRAEDQSVMHKLHDDPTLGWGEVADGGIEVITVPGNHAVMLIKPYIETVGATLKDCLERARAEHEPARTPQDQSA